MAARYTCPLDEEGLGVLRSAAKGNPWHGWLRPGCRCRTGFHITTAAYDAFVAGHGLTSRITALVGDRGSGRCV